MNVLEICDPLAYDAMAKLLKEKGCRQAVSALYVDNAKNVQITFGVVEFSTAADAGRVAGAKNAKGFHWITPPAGSGVVSVPGGVDYFNYQGALNRYLLYAKSGPADGKSSDAEDQKTAITIVRELVEDAITRRAGG